MSSRAFLPPLVLTFSLMVACSPPGPLISSPAEEWEATAERGRVPIPQPLPYPTPYRHPIAEDVPSDAEKTPGEVFETALADIVGFPFRAAAWLAHVLL